MRNGRRWGLLLGGALVLGSLCGCERITPQARAQEPEHEEHEELAPYMSLLQRYSHKLGFAVAADNHPLATFYLEEIHEVVEEMKEEVPTHDGLEIARDTEMMFEPVLAGLEASVAEEDWEAARANYRATVQSCNSCHQKQKHGFIEILPAEGEPPYNQRF